jgi:type II secretory pathway pseudopilin PulG
MSKKSAFSLVEIMIFMVLLVTASTASYSFLSSGQKLANTTEYRVQAINLAREGIEIVRTYRDTNWIAYSSDKEHCWMVDRDIDTVDPGTCVGWGATLLGSGFYIPDLDVQPWVLKKQSVDFDATGNFDAQRAVYLVGMKGNSRTPYQGWDLRSLPTCEGAASTDNCRTRYWRAIQLIKESDTKYVVKVWVGWMEGDGIPKSAMLEMDLINI